MILLDGSQGEGGGQIIRTALALSSLTGKPFSAVNIRAGRAQPGLKAQHVQCVKALEQICNAKSRGAEQGSCELEYFPGKINAKNLTIDIGTAGSITLLLQAILLPAIFAQKTHKLTLIGGTDTKWSMPIDYFANVLVPQYKRLCEIDILLLKRGYYPKGGGVVEITVKPEIKRNEFDSFEGFQAVLSGRAFKIDKQGELESIKGTSHASKDLEQAKVAERQAQAARQALASLNVPIEIATEYSETQSTGAVITLWAVFSQNGDITEQTVRIGANALGDKRKTAEQVGNEAAQKLIDEIKSEAPVDRHLADNLIPIMGLCRQSMIKVSQITMHTKTNMQIAENFLGKTFKEEKNVIIST